MKNAVLTALAAGLLLFGVRSSRGDCTGEVENIVYMTESQSSADLAEKVANLIITHGLGDKFLSIFIIDNKGDKALSPIMILKLSKKGESLTMKNSPELDKLVEEATFLFAKQHEDSKVSLYIQNNDHSNLIEAVYDPGENKVKKKKKGSAASPPAGEEEAITPPVEEPTSEQAKEGGAPVLEDE